MPSHLRCGSFALILATLAHVALAKEENAATRWLSRFSFLEPEADASGVCNGTVGVLPTFSVEPKQAGNQLVRISLPFAPAGFPKGLSLTVHAGGAEITPDVRVLTYHPGTPVSVRRAILTFPYEFTSTRPVKFTLTLTPFTGDSASIPFDVTDSGLEMTFATTKLSVDVDQIRIDYDDGNTYTLRLIAPPRLDSPTPRIELVEYGQHYRWIRMLLPDSTWPRIVEVRVDSMGRIAVRGHLQRLEEGDAYAPEIGWEANCPPSGLLGEDKPNHGVVSADDRHVLTVPGLADGADVTHTAEGDRSQVRLVTWKGDQTVPMQQSAWRSTAICVGPSLGVSLNRFLEPDLTYSIDDPGATGDLNLAAWSVLDDLQRYTRDAIVRSALHGIDEGNITSFNPGGPASVYGMNRLNHCPAIFDEARRSGDPNLRDAAVAWCSNMYDLSIWWGDTEDFGGTRYNNASAAGQKQHEGDQQFMWRTNGASNFCTKGYDSFFLAYEETGDPRMLAALRAQVDYAGHAVHTDRGECRNIGDVADFMRLYRMTGMPEYKDEALRLFRELRTKLSAGDLFSQGGQPIVEDGPFINDDAHGYDAPFAKPYIIGYALAGLPELLRVAPDEAKLRDVVRAVADFLAESMDPVGGWRYPHPRSSGLIISQGMEHAAQLCRAAAVLDERGEDISSLVDAIEHVLQARVLAFRKTGQVLSGLQGWEESAGALSDGKTIYDLYQKPADRDPLRDYSEGAVGIGGAPPEGLVYLTEVLQFYLKHRPAERLFNACPELQQVLARVDDRRLKLTPEPAGSFVRVARPENPEIGYTLWAPEWSTYPTLGYSQEELGGMKLEWTRNDEQGSVSYSIDRPEATFQAEFVPHIDYVECAYTAWPKPDVPASGSFGVGPCQQMKAGIFEGDEAELMTRMYFLSDGEWVALGSCANGNTHNIQYLKGQPSPEVTGDMVTTGWKTIQNPRPDIPLLTCVSRDGNWVAATAAENGLMICNNSAESHRCMHSHGTLAVNANGPTTLRVSAYLANGSKDDVLAMYRRDRNRWAETPATPGSDNTQTAAYGVRDLVPAFNESRIREMKFPGAFLNSASDFQSWRKSARETYLKRLGAPPGRVPFDVATIAEDDRTTHVAKKIAVNISPTERVSAYLLVPKGEGPFPAVVALHDHGAHFSIGKEKVVQPFLESEERTADANDWTTKYYGGRYFGDELARRGYVVFATDALFWGDRGRFGGVKYEDQQALGANMLQLGLVWAGKIVWDDVRSAEFVQSLPYVDPERIGCMGLSMGAHRTWSLAAATDIVRCGAAICWMGDTPTLASPGNNQTTGQSAFSMLVPGLRNYLDYPDVASIACPKPMLFFNGTEDGLFPVPGVEASYQKMKGVWDSQGKGDRLVTKLWPVPHLYNAEMQDEAFAWLDKQLK